MTSSASTTTDNGYRTLITDRPWDDYDLKSLLPLKETYQENTEFGFLLRHYWIPATELRFRQSTSVTTPDGDVDRQELRIDRQMARCRSNECTWREKVFPAAATIGKNADTGVDVPMSEMLCSYDCYDQTYTSAKPILFELPTDAQKLEAQRQALYCLPILVPPGPVPIGFAWYAKVGDDYMNFRLEAEHKIGDGDTSVLVIRREGRYTTRLATGAAGSNKERKTTPVVAERQGVTLFAWNRGVILEDRLRDQIIDAEEPLASRVNTISQAVIRLVRSVSTKSQ